MVPYSSPCVCKGCAKTSIEQPWGCYKYDAVLKKWVPAEDGCQDCVATLQDAVAPQKLSWKAFGPRLLEPQTAQTFEDWRLRHAGMPSNFDKSDVTTDEDCEVNWIDSHLPQTEADLQAAYPNTELPETLPWCDIADGHGQNHRVVLVYQGSRVEISHKTTAHMATRLLSADRQLRERQGADAFREARKRSQPPKHVTPEELSQRMSSGGPAKQPEDEVLNSLMSGGESELGVQAALGYKRPRVLRGVGSNPEEPDGKHGKVGSVGESNTLTPPMASTPPVASTTPIPPIGPVASGSKDSSTAAALVVESGRTAAARAGEIRQQPPELPKAGRGRARGGTGKNQGGRGRGGKKEGGKKEGEVEFNLINTLAGLIEKPRVELYNRRQRLPGFAKQAHESEVMAEEAQIKVLEAAINLSPAEIRNVEQAVLDSSVKLCQKSLAGDKWPKETVLGLTRRAAMARLESPGDFLKISWPFGSANSPADTPAPAFDPADPRLCHETALVSVDEKIDAFENMIVKDFVAIFLRKGQSGMSTLAAMGESFQEYFSRAVGKDTQRISNLRKCVLAISALAQQTTITPDQFEAFEALDQGKLSYSETLEPCLSDTFWEERKALLWEVAAYESTTHAILENIVRIAGQGPPIGTDQQETLDDAWGLTRKRWTAWTEKMRPGALQPVAEALAQQLVGEAGAMQTQAVQANVALARAKQLDDRTSWLAEVMPSVAPQLADSQRILRNAITGWDAQVKMSEGNRLLCEMITMLEAGNEVSLSLVTQLRAEYEGCVGICPPAEITDNLGKVMDFLAGIEAAELASDHAWLAARVNTLLVAAADAAGEGDSCADSPGTRPSQEKTVVWTKTAKGLELHEALNAQTQGDIRIAALAQKIEAFQDQSGEALESLRGFLEPRIQQARQELTSKEEGDLANLIAEAQGNLTVLASKAGGKPDGLWKAELKDDSSWEDVQREAQYHFFKHGQTSKEDVSHDIDKAHEKLTKVMALVAAKEKRIAGLSSEAAPARPEGFGQRVKEITQLAKATLLEIKFLKAMAEAPSQRSKKIKERVTSMSRHGLSPDDIQPTLWQKVTLEMKK